ncbi:hypothetical protein [Streptomyces sp. NPDC059466]|uniref:hypothetical protein n=1 Tax=unclassified Streptomyces TaxID=2593676 RepID=UPI0036A8EB52
MESEVITALLGTPAVLITAAAAWFAGRAQSRSAYQGPVDAVRRASQREAYVDLYRASRRFDEACKAADWAHLGLPGDPGQKQLTQEVLNLLDQMHEAQDALQHAMYMVCLEGPDNLAEIAVRLHNAAQQRGGSNTRWGRSNPLLSGNIDTDEKRSAQSVASFAWSKAEIELLPAVRRYLNGRGSL